MNKRLALRLEQARGVHVLVQDAHLPEADRSKVVKDRDKRWRSRKIVHNVTSVLFLPHSDLLASAGRSPMVLHCGQLLFDY